MNPLTNVKNISKLSDTELRLGVEGKASWHSMYSHSAWIFVGGLNFDLTEGDVICVFSQYGEIADINMVRDKETGKSKGFCFICYEDQRSTTLAVDNLNGIKLVGRIIRVDHCGNYETPEQREKKRQEEKEKRNKDRGPNWNGDRDRGRERDRNRDPERERERDRNRDPDLERERNRDRDRNRELEKEGDRDNDRGKNRDRDRNRDLERDRDRDRNKDRDNRHRDHAEKRKHERRSEPYIKSEKRSR